MRREEEILLISKSDVISSLIETGQKGVRSVFSTSPSSFAYFFGPAMMVDVDRSQTSDAKSAAREEDLAAHTESTHVSVCPGF